MEETLDKSTLSIGDKSMLEKLLVKSPSEMGEDEIAIIRARRAYLTAVERKVFEEVLVIAPEKVDYMKLTVPKLKELCAARKIEIPAEVTLKPAIVALIEEADATPEEEEEEEE